MRVASCCAVRLCTGAFGNAVKLKLPVMISCVHQQATAEPDLLPGPLGE